MTTRSPEKRRRVKAAAQGNCAHDEREGHSEVRAPIEQRGPNVSVLRLLVVPEGAISREQRIDRLRVMRHELTSLADELSAMGEACIAAGIRHGAVEQIRISLAMLHANTSVAGHVAKHRRRREQRARNRNPTAEIEADVIAIVERSKKHNKWSPAPRAHVDAETARVPVRRGLPQTARADS